MKSELIKKYRKIFIMGTWIHNHLQLQNKLHLPKSNSLLAGVVILKNTKLKIKGNNNEIVIDDYTRLNNCRIVIMGNNNKVFIGKNCSLNGTEIHIEDSYNTISIGEKTTIQGKTHLAAIEGTKISIGEDCMLSSDIHITTGDSHSIIDLENNRINPSKDIKIGNHVWIGTKVTCLKNTEIADNCIVGATATVCGKHLKPNCIISGVPAKVLKENISWLRQRI